MVRSSVILFLAAFIVLSAAACSGDKNETEPAASPEATSADTANSTASATSAAGDSPGASSAATTATSEQSAAPTPTTAPATKNELRSMSNVLLGVGQELVLWLHALFGDVECGAGCAGNNAQRWKTVADICAAKKWTLIKAERGYDPRLHDELMNAMNDACARVSERLNAQSPVDDEEWRQFASDTLDMVTPYLDNLLEAGTKEGFLN